jgi:hypothetical protein
MLLVKSQASYEEFIQDSKKNQLWRYEKMFSIRKIFAKKENMEGNTAIKREINHGSGIVLPTRKISSEGIGNLERKKMQELQNKIIGQGNNIALTKGVVPDPRKRQFIKKGILGLIAGIGIAAFSKMTGAIQNINFNDDTTAIDLNPAGKLLTSNFQDFVEGGVSKILYMLGGVPNMVSAVADDDEVGFGSCWRVNLNGAGSTITKSTTVRGGWNLTSGAADQRSVSLYAGQAALDPASDWTIICRANITGALFEVGLSDTPAAYRPGGAQNNSIAISIATGGALYTITDNGGTETQNSGSTGLTGEHTFRIEITGGGTSVAFYLDDALEDTITTNIPASTSMYLFVNVSSVGGETRTAHLADLFAWREV